jgi:peptide/nickel transport system permease protein
VRRASRFRRLLRVNFVVGSLMVGLMVMIAIVGLFWTPLDANALAIGTRLSAPGENGHLLGSDGAGRDVASLLMVGARSSVVIASVASISALILGTLVGGLAVVYGGKIDELLMRSADVLYAFPAVIFAVILSASLGSGILSVVIAIVVIFTPTTARLVRGVSLQMMGRDWVLAARAYGRRPMRIYIRQVVPNISATLIVQGALLFAVSILVEAALSYLGLGVQPPTPSWGRMLRDSQDFLSVQSALALWPGLCIVVTVLGVNLMGDGLRDAFDPRGLDVPR